MLFDSIHKLREFEQFIRCLMKRVVAQNSRKKTCMPPESSSKLRIRYLDEDCFFPSILGLVTFSCFAFRI